MKTRIKPAVLIVLVAAFLLAVASADRLQAQDFPLPPTDRPILVSNLNTAYAQHIWHSENMAATQFTTGTSAATFELLSVVFRLSW